ncbi:MAG TPA: VWA domain-containing protein, partial [Gemmataceae bacterium]|nr:VWA domain-containing protein [Gemmataceae bacterium]
MTFVFPVLLGGMVLVGIPVLIHLIMRQKPKILPFPAFRFLVQRSKKNLRKLRLRHLLLLLLRMLLLAAICLALARPKLFQSGLSLSADRPVAAILLFDTSFSMGYKTGDGVTRLDEAKTRGLELLNELPEGSRVAILDTAEAVASRGEWHKSVHQARERIKELKLKPANASVSLRLQDAYRMFAALAQSTEDHPPLRDLPRFLCVFSDRTRASWDADRLTQLYEAGDQIPPTLPGLTRLGDGIPALIDSLKELRKTIPPEAGQDYPEQALIDALTPLREAIAGLDAGDIADSKELPKLLDAVRKPARQIVMSLHGTKDDKLPPDAKEYRQKLLTNLQSALSGMQGVYSLFIDVGVDRPVDLAISNLELRDEFGQPQQAFAANRKVILRADVKATGKDYNTTIQFRIGTKTFEWAVVVKAGETKPEFFRIDCAELGLLPGPQQVEVRLGTSDLLPFNNSRYATFMVREPRRVLVLADKTNQATEFQRALTANGFAPEVKTPG